MPAPSPERAAAKAAGHRTYETGKPCKRGHIAPRYTATRTCTMCFPAWRSENIDAAKAREAKWREGNREIANSRSAEWRAKYPDRQRQAEIVYRAENPDKRKASCARWREGNPDHDKEYGKAWRARNKPHIAAKSARRRSAKRQATPKWADHRAIKAIYEQAARLTFETGEQWDVDHIYPLVHELVCGLHCEANLQVLRATENRSKCNRIPPEMFDPQPMM